MRLLLSVSGKIAGRFLARSSQRFCYSTKMEKFGVVPDVIKTAPLEIAEIKYGNLSLELGNELTPTQVKVKLYRPFCFLFF